MKYLKDDSRRDFLKAAGLGAAALAGLGAGTFSRAAGAAEPADEKRKRPLTLAMASYTLRKFSLDEALAMTAQLGMDAICLKSFHLPLDATADQIAAAVDKSKKAGVRIYGGGVIGMKNEEQVAQAFDYAKAAGMSKIIAAPSVEMLPAINDKIQQYDIQVCIHNHGPGDNTFPTPDVAYEKIKMFDKRFGLCHDVGHTVRYGKDPIAMTEKCADRILDVHMKDVTEATKAGHATPCGRGVIDIPGVLDALVKIGYKGYVAFEYEESPDAPLPGVAESVGYVRGVLDVM